MDGDQFRLHGKRLVDFITDLSENIRDVPVVADVTPGYLPPLLPDSAPEDPEDFQTVFDDFQKLIMPGVTHWRSPRFHGYYPSSGSYPSILGDMLSDAVAGVGLNWAANPALTELEMVSTDWLGKMLGLPAHFLHCSPGPGGGVIQTSASDTVLLCVLAARSRMVTRMTSQRPDLAPSDVIARLVGYFSDQSNSSVHRLELLSALRMRALESDEDFSLRGETLAKAIEEDKKKGYIPFFVCATLGTTGTCAFDNLQELGPLCQRDGLWLHVDAAYAGSAFVCPEFRHLLHGVEFADTFNMNPHKWMLCNFDCSVMWIRDREHLVDAFSVDPVYLRHQHEGHVPDYRHWGVPLGRRFRSLKLWFVLRTYGVKGIQQYIRKHVSLAKELDSLLTQDGRFEMVVPTVMGLVCFRVKGPNEVTERMYQDIVSRRHIFLIPAKARRKGEDVYFLRVAMAAEGMTSGDIQATFQALVQSADSAANTFAQGDGCGDSGQR